MLGSTPLLSLAEDEAALAELFAEFLADAGFDVRTASDGGKAIAALREGQFHALITDIRLPSEGPNGWELARRARELHPDMAVIYVSGDSAVEWAAQGVPRSVMLAKPFAPAQLVAAVANLLNAVPPA
jgi:DNA-binding response OmpR family regulator